MKSTIYILGASATAHWSGSDGMWIQAAKQLQVNHDVHVISPIPKNVLQELGLTQVKHTPLPAMAHAKSKVGAFVMKAFGVLTLEMVRPAGHDVVVFSQGSVDTFADGLYKHWLNRCSACIISVTQLNTEYEVPSKKIRSLGRRFFSKTWKNVFVSQRNLDTARRQFLLPLNNAEVIHNSPKMDIEDLPWPEASILKLACVGRYQAQTKGQLVLLEALREFSEESWELHFYGSGPDKHLIREAIDFYGLSQRCFIHGYVSNPSEIWKRCHVLALVSTMEGFPLVISEAMLAGRVCLVSDVGGNVEVLSENQRPFVASAPNVAQTKKDLRALFATTSKELEAIGVVNMELARRNMLHESSSPLATMIEDFIPDFAQKQSMK